MEALEGYSVYCIIYCVQRGHEALQSLSSKDDVIRIWTFEKKCFCLEKRTNLNSKQTSETDEWKATDIIHIKCCICFCLMFYLFHCLLYLILSSHLSEGEALVLSTLNSKLASYTLTARAVVHSGSAF